MSSWCHATTGPESEGHYSEVMAEEKRITLRLPADLHEWLVAQAKSARRSLNSEIVYRLEVDRDTDVAAEDRSP
ncbi:toxin-antitoxin system HicB family antitoxin [Streptomyces griseoaurantiacus]